MVLEAAYDLARGMLLRMLGPSQDLDDLVQTTVLRVAESLPKLRSPEAFSTWAGGITVNLARDFVRGRPRARAHVPYEESHVVEHGGAERDAAARVQLRRTLQVLGGLSEAHRTVFVLRVVLGHSVEEIAAMTGSAHSTTRLRLYYARKHFAKLVAAELGPADGSKGERS